MEPPISKPLAARAKTALVQLVWSNQFGVMRYDVYRTSEYSPFVFEKIGETNSRGVLTRETATETGGLVNGFSTAGCGNASIANRSSRGRKAGAKAESRFEIHLRSGLGADCYS